MCVVYGGWVAPRSHEDAKRDQTRRAPTHATRITTLNPA